MLRVNTQGQIKGRSWGSGLDPPPPFGGLPNFLKRGNTSHCMQIEYVLVVILYPESVLGNLTVWNLEAEFMRHVDYFLSKKAETYTRVPVYREIVAQKGGPLEGIMYISNGFNMYECSTNTCSFKSLVYTNKGQCHVKRVTHQTIPH